jgi:predicted O-methyltransferase YrrM
VIGAMLERAGRGRLVSLEHDPAYAERIRRLVGQAGLADRVEIVVAPLRPCRLEQRVVPWYDTGITARAADAPIDVLVVDGPPQLTRWSRWPAVPVLHDRLAPGATVLVDDGRTAAALTSTAAWTRAFPDMERYWLDSLKGTWILERRAGAPRDRRLVDVLRPAVSALSPRPSGSGRWPVRR